MPRIPDELLRCTFYTYMTLEDAISGTRFGGTGFLLSKRSKTDPTKSITFAVTNWHVAVRGGFSCIRIAKLEGGVDVFDFDPCEWEFRPSWHDLAMIPIAINSEIHDVLPLSEDVLICDDFLIEEGVGIGDDVLMVGRFVDHDGGATNVPAVRFGNISIMPQCEIEQPTGGWLTSYVVDMHSRSGYSGSPVFVYRVAGTDFRLNVTKKTQRGFCYLLGVHWGQFKEPWEISRAIAPRAVRGDAMSDAGDVAPQQVQGPSGMGCVIPASAVRELLYCQKFSTLFEEAERRLQDHNTSV